MARMAKGLVDMACLVPYSRKGVLWELRVQMHLPVDKRSGTRRKAGLFLPVRCASASCCAMGRPAIKEAGLAAQVEPGDRGRLGKQVAATRRNACGYLSGRGGSPFLGKGSANQRPFFSSSRISRSSTTSSAGAAGAAASCLTRASLALLNTRTIWKMMKARIRKFRKMVMKLP